MVTLVRRHPFWTFVLLAYGWTWPLAALGGVSLAFPLLGLFGPAFAAVVVCRVTGGEVMGMAFDASGALLATAYAPNSPLYRVNTATGAATAVGASTSFAFPHGGDILVGAGGTSASTTVRVNNVAPGSILFPGGSWYARQQADPAGIAEFVRRELPFGRFGRPEEVGAVVAFLASPRASWICGASIVVDGCQSRSNI